MAEDLVINQTSKDCKRCGQSLSSDEFYKNPKASTGLSSWCRSCTRQGRLERKVLGTRKERDFVRRLEQKYSLSLKEYNDMLLKQEGRCKICGIPQIALAEALVVDHDHKSSKVRGLLCKQCNLVLGNAKDSPEILLRAADYLKV
jgi:hypothetical protein